MVWPLKNKFGVHYILECPVCHNRLLFKAVDFHGHRIWNCELCKRRITLNLIPQLPKYQFDLETAFHSTIN